MTKWNSMFFAFSVITEGTKGKVLQTGNTKWGSITVSLTSGLTGLD